MFVNTDVYLKRLMSVLENVIAPEIESDHVRGQVFAVIDLLNQLSGKIEYKAELIKLDIEAGASLVRRLVAVLQEHGGDPPAELTRFLQEQETGDLNCRLGLRQRVEEMVCLALDFFHEHKNRLLPAAADRLDREVRDYLLKIATRDLGLMKPPLLEKISRSKR